MTQVARRPLRADARRNRERVLAAARTVFSEAGRDAQMDDVARRAEVGVGTVYRHFPTKEALIEALAMDAFERLAGFAKEALAIDDPWEGLSQTLWTGASILAGDRALAELLAEIPGPIAITPELQRELNGAMQELIRRAQATGQLRADLVLDDIVMVMCGVGAATRKTHQCPESWRRHVAIVLDGMRAGSVSTPLPTGPCTE